MPSRYFRNTGSTAWSTTTNWSATDGGGSVGAIPTALDDVFFTSNSGSCDINIGALALTVNCTGFINTLTNNGALTVSGSITFSSGMTFSGSGSLIVNANSTITTAGKILNNFTATATATITLADTMNVTTLTLGATAMTFAGSFGWIAASLVITTTTSIIHILKATIIYRAGSFIAASTPGGTHATIKSDTGGSKAKLYVTGDMRVGFIDFTDIDASGGRPISTFNGTVTTCTNIISMIDKVNVPISSSFTI